MILYRIQHPTNQGGAWYNEDGSSNRIVDELSCKKLAMLPMEPDPARYHADNKRWQCAAWDIDHLKQWFSESDTEELLAKGFKLAKFISHDFIVQENQVLFTMDSVELMEFHDSYKSLEESLLLEVTYLN